MSRINGGGNGNDNGGGRVPPQEPGRNANQENDSGGSEDGGGGGRVPPQEPRRNGDQNNGDGNLQQPSSSRGFISPLSVKNRRNILNLRRIITEPFQRILNGITGNLKFWNKREERALRIFPKAWATNTRTKGISGDYKNFKKKYLNADGSWKDRNWFHSLLKGRTITNGAGEIESVKDIDFILNRAKKQRNLLDVYHYRARAKSNDKRLLKKQKDEMEKIIEELKIAKQKYFIFKKSYEQKRAPGYKVDANKGFTKDEFIYLRENEKGQEKLANYVALKVQSEGFKDSAKKAKIELKGSFNRGEITKAEYESKQKQIDAQLKQFEEKTVEGLTISSMEKKYKSLKNLSLGELVNFQLFGKLSPGRKSLELLATKKVEGAAVHVDISQRTLDPNLVNPDIKHQIEVAMGGRQLSEDSPQTVIGLSGVPGTGKTYSAQLIAKQNNANYIEISQMAYKYVGESGEKIRAAFKSIRKNKPAVVLMDELDKAVKSGNKGASGDIVKALQEELEQTTENKGIIFIWGSNYPQNIPSALINRTKRIVHVKPPIDPNNVNNATNLNLAVRLLENLRDDVNIGCQDIRSAGINMDTPVIRQILKDNPWATVRDYRNNLETANGELYVAGGPITQARFETEFERLMRQTSPTEDIRNMYQNSEEASGFIGRITISQPGLQDITAVKGATFQLNADYTIPGTANPIPNGTNCIIDKIKTDSNGVPTEIYIRSGNNLAAYNTPISQVEFLNLFHVGNATLTGAG